MKETLNYKLKKIELTDSPPDITVHSGNFDIIDAEMKKIDDKASSAGAEVAAVQRNLDEHLEEDVHHKVITGSFVADGERTIDLGFRPKFVKCVEKTGGVSGLEFTYIDGMSGIFVIDDSTLYVDLPLEEPPIRNNGFYWGRSTGNKVDYFAIG